MAADDRFKAVYVRGLWAPSHGLSVAEEPVGVAIGVLFNEPVWMVPGNSKAQRRWRRRNIPNTQRTAAIGRERAVIAAFFREDG